MAARSLYTKGKILPNIYNVITLYGSSKHKDEEDETIYSEDESTSEEVDDWDSSSDSHDSDSDSDSASELRRWNRKRRKYQKSKKSRKWSSHEILLCLWSVGRNPIDTKRIDYLIVGFTRKTERHHQYPDEIMHIIEGYIPFERTRQTRNEMPDDLYTACSDGNIDIVRQILYIDQNMASLARHDITDHSALMIACKRAHFEVVQELLQTNKIEVNEQNYQLMTALHLAAKAGDGEICKLLIDHGINIDICDEDGTTALFYAVEKGHTDIVRLLCQHHVDVNLC